MVVGRGEAGERPSWTASAPDPCPTHAQGIIGGSIGYTLVPLDKVDLSLVSVLYTQGDFAAVTPVYTYALENDDGVPIPSAYSAWRPLLGALGPPGLLIAALCLLTVGEPRTKALTVAGTKRGPFAGPGLHELEVILRDWSRV